MLKTKSQGKEAAEMCRKPDRASWRYRNHGLVSRELVEIVRSQYTLHYALHFRDGKRYVSAYIFLV